MSLKLRELWNECEKMEPGLLGVFVEGLLEMVRGRNDASLTRREEPIRACVAEKKKADAKARWTPAEEDLLHKCVNEEGSTTQGVTRFLAETGYARSYKASEHHVDVMRREGKW